MVGMSLSALKFKRGVTSSLAIALSLSGVTVAGSALIAAPAAAKEKEKPKTQEMQVSREFAKAYQPVSDLVNAEGGDLQVAKSQMAGVEAAVENAADRYYAGNLYRVLGSKLNDTPMIRKGVELMLQSGNVPAEQLGTFNYVAGNLAYAGKDYGAARDYMKRALDAGYVDKTPDALDDPELITTLAYMAEGNKAGGLSYLDGVVTAREAAGQPIPEQWLLNGLQAAYDLKDPAAATRWSAALVRAYDTPENWSKGLRVVAAVNDFTKDGQLDLLRLMRTTDSLDERVYFTRYVELADERIRSNEVLGVLQDGVDAGVFTTGDDFYKQVKASADQRSAADRTEAPKLAAEAAGAANGNAARGAADVYYTLGNYAEAAKMYSLALEKGVDNTNVMLTRLGMSQALSGDYAAAKASLAKVTGADKNVATMWEAYVNTKA